MGPHDPALCGRCFGGSCEIGATPTLASCDPTSIPYWPPTNMPYSLLFGILFAFGGLLLLGLVLFGMYLMVHIGRRMRAGRKGTFNINVRPAIQTINKFVLSHYIYLKTFRRALKWEEWN